MKNRESTPGSWKPGQCGNPLGRPRGKTVTVQLEKAIKRVEKNHDIKLIDYFVERAYKNDVVLIALMKKLLLDKRFAEKELQVDPIDFTKGIIVLPAKLPVGAQSGNINAPETENDNKMSK
jgi:hypothetical protein